MCETLLNLNSNVSSLLDLKKIHKEKIHIHICVYVCTHTHTSYMALMADFNSTEKMMHSTQPTWIGQQPHGSGCVSVSLPALGFRSGGLWLSALAPKPEHRGSNPRPPFLAAGPRAVMKSLFLASSRELSEN